MNIPVFKVAKDKYYIQYLTILNPIFWKLGTRTLWFLSLLVKYYDNLKNKYPSHEVTSNVLLSDEMLKQICEENKIAERSMRKFINDLKDKNIINKNDYLQEKICVNPQKDSELMLKWQINE